MSTVTYTGEDGAPVVGEPVEDAAARIAALEAQVDALLAAIAGEA